MVIVYYLFDHDKTENPVDRVIIDGVARLWKSLFGNRPKPSLKWSESIEAAVLMFSDQQLVTDIGILMSGYLQLKCALSTYHWEIVVYLAWFSSLTHLITLATSRAFFREQPTLAYWRVFFMGCLVVLLATALAPTGYVAQTQYSLPLSAPALCLFSSEGAHEAYEALVSQSSFSDQVYLQIFNWLYIYAALLFLVGTYLVRVASFFLEQSQKTRVPIACTACISMEESHSCLDRDVECFRCSSMVDLGVIITSNDDSLCIAESHV